MFHNILVPVDIGEAEVAAEAIAAAVELAKAFDSNLRLIHVASPIIPGSPMAVIPQSVYDEIGVNERSQLEAMAGAIELPSAKISTSVRIGGVYPELLAEAAQWPADLIVVGAHRRSMASYLLGSTSAAVSRHAACTVMIARSSIRAKII